MFTGIVQMVGAVDARTASDAGVTFSISAPKFCEVLKPGDSVSINGACHTVIESAADDFRVTSVAETLKVTTMSLLDVGSSVNLEQAATLATALGGHLVQGHVDGTASVDSIKRVPGADGEDWLLTLALLPEQHQLVVPRGSIAVDGVSLTVVNCLPDHRITITIIPFTLEHTTLGKLKPGSRVNIETDIIGKYVNQYVERIGADRSMPTNSPVEEMRDNE